MKTFKKVLASALAAAMVVTAFPVTNAEAATAPKLSTTKATLYVGQSKTITVKNLTSTWKGAKVVSASDKKSVATVSRKGNKITVKAVKAGTAKVTVKVTPKKGAAKKLTAKITVKTPTVKFTDSVSEVAVGATETLTATSTPKATVKFYSADKSIATVGVTSGVVTGVKEGTVKIAAKFYTGKKENKVYKEITVKKQIFKDLTQTTANTFTAVIAGDTKDLKASDFSIVNVATKATVAIKEVAVDKKDSTKVTITTFANLTDGKAYAVTLNGTTKEITVTDGTVASVAVTPTEIPYATATTIKVVAKDASGVIVAQSKDDGTLPDGYALTITTKTGYVTNNDLYLTNKGDTAVAKAVKHSYKFDNTGKEIETVESGDITITAVDPAAVSGFALRFAGTASKFDDAKDGNTMPVGTSKDAYIKITDANGNEANYAGYSVASSDASVLQVSGALGGQNSKITLVAIKTGTAYVLVKDSKSNVVASLPIVIQDAAKPVALALDKTSVVLSNSKEVTDKATVTATAKDQYSEAYAIDADVTVTCNATSAKDLTAKDVNDNKTNYYSVDNGAVTFYGTEGGSNSTSLTKGSYVYEIKYTKGNDTTNSVYVTVEIKDPTESTATDYAFAGELDSFDTTISDTNKQTKKIGFNLYELKGGVKNAPVADANVSYSVKKDGKDITTTKSPASNTSGIFEDSNTITVVALGVDGTTATKLEAGVYTITATYANAGKTYTRTATLKITDKQPALTAKVVNNSVSKNNATNGEALVKEAVEFYYNGTKIADPVIADVEGVCAKANVTTNTSLKDNSNLASKGYVVTFTKAKVTVTITGSVTYDMEVTIPNGVVTITD